MRIRVHFAKTEAMRFTSHLDLYRTWERTIRRSGLPLTYTIGFKPHPRINLGSALPLGFTSKDEVVDIWIDHENSLTEIETALQRAIPPGIRINQVVCIDQREPSLQSMIGAAQYEVEMLEVVPDLEARLTQLLHAGEIARKRRGKEYDLRPLIYDLSRLPDSREGNQRIHMILSSRDNATGRPEEVVQAIGGDPASSLIQRVRLLLISELNEDMKK